MKNRNILLVFSLILVFAFLVIASAPVQAVPPVPGDVFDDFEANNPSDWGYFGGSNGGGGFGTLDDRPKEGSYYLSTGWGGGGGTGAVPGFYGGLFKNLDNGSQLTLPADPWFNVWVLNQSDATADAYTLEITIREDLDGNGWSDGADESFRYDATYTSSSFDDEWRILSAPVSSFTDLGVAGDGAFTGNLDEMVFVIAGVNGADGSIVEVDFDQITFTSGAPAAFDKVVFDDMEHGDPGTDGWFAFGGTVGGGGIGPNATDLPPSDGGAFSLETGWGSGGVPGFFGGFGRTNPVDISGTDYFNFWINPDAGQDYLLEINLQDDDNEDNAIPFPPTADDDEFQFNCVVSPTGPCAVAGGGWQLVSIPLADFFDDNSGLTGGNGILDPTPASRGGNGQLINVVFAIIGNSGSDVNFRTDYWAFTSGSLVPDFRQLIDDFESGVAPGTPCDGIPLGFCTFAGGGSTATLANPATPPAPVLPAVGTPNNVLQLDLDVNDFAGFIRGFETGGEWVSQDWSTSEGFSLWFHGTGSGSPLFIDILENRNPGSTTDDAERWRVDFVDDFIGWQQLEYPFSAFRQFNVSNGAPNDGNFDRFEVHGWAIGALNTPEPLTYYVDQVELYGAAEPPDLAVGFALVDTPIEEGTTGDVVVKLNRPMNSDDPAQVSVDFATDIAGAIAGEEYTPTSGTLTFVNGGPFELTFPIETFDDTKFEGDERIVLRLSNPIDVELSSTQARALIVDNEAFDPLLLDDFEQGAFLWESDGPVSFDAQRVESGDAIARPGQDAVENILMATVPLNVDIVVQGNVCNKGNGVVPVHLLSTPDFDATTVDHTSVTFGDATETHGKRHVDDVNGDGLDDLVFHFRSKDIGVPCGDPIPFNGTTLSGDPITAGGSDAAFYRDFALGQDWSETETVDFWYYGAGGGEEVIFTLKDNRAPDPGPSGWNLVWSDEFEESAGTPPNPANWSYELGDGALNGIEGWGNSELQYYTDDPANAQTDGDGNLVITLEEADGSLECFYGTCEYTSARLISLHKAEFAYGRIESRLRVPNEGADYRGLWPAFWSLGTDISYNPWPGAGEIDIMEWVGRLPNEIFGTIHGPGYSGGNAVGNIYDFGLPVPDDYHTFTIEWEPDLIVWYVDGIEYHRADPNTEGVNGPWVFNKPFFLLLNFAIGGNFGGPVGDDVQFPQEYLIDYVRVYQGPDTAERFEASFTDSVAGWQEVSIPITEFTRSADQPAGAPDDGLTLTDVWGYGFALPEGNASGEVGIDLVSRYVTPPPPNPVFDDFEDGDASDWGFFSGNAAGGGGGIATDRPAEGAFYFSTGWGGNGSDSGFYGGAFRNVETADQANLPADPWFNVWVLNQSNATVDSYTLEITLREDLDGNGWTSGTEDSIRLDTAFTSADFDDQWTLISAPLSSFMNLNTGGDGTFNGDLDEVVIVLSNVQGASESTVEVDFDYFAFSSGGPIAVGP